MITRREFLATSASALAAGGLTSSTAAESPKRFHLWACVDSHVGTDIKKGRESLAKANRQSDEISFSVTS